MNEVNNSENTCDFNFDEWMALYKNDPEKFEKMRLELVDKTINQAPKSMHRRLNGLQWRIDSEVKLAKSPLEGCVRVYQMMMASVYKKGGLQDALSMTIDTIQVKKSTFNVTKIKESSSVSEIDD